MQYSVATADQGCSTEWLNTIFTRTKEVEMAHFVKSIAIGELREIQSGWRHSTDDVLKI